MPTGRRQNRGYLCRPIGVPCRQRGAAGSAFSPRRLGERSTWPRQAAPAPRRRDARPAQPDGPNGGGAQAPGRPRPRPERQRAAEPCDPAPAPARPCTGHAGRSSLAPSGADAPSRAAPATMPSGSGRLRTRAQPFLYRRAARLPCGIIAKGTAAAHAARKEGPVRPRGTACKRMDVRRTSGSGKRRRLCMRDQARRVPRLRSPRRAPARPHCGAVRAPGDRARPCVPGRQAGRGDQRGAGRRGPLRNSRRGSPWHRAYQAVLRHWRARKGRPRGPRRPDGGRARSIRERE